MNRGKNSVSIPNDLISEILSRLPAKSIARLRCVSKLWGSMLGHPYFTELFLARSSGRPRLLLVVQRERECLFYSSPQAQYPYGKSSLVLGADFHLKFSLERMLYDCRYASGLINFPIRKTDKDAVHVIYNPSIGKYIVLPELKTVKYSKRFLGFDPIDKQFKLLLMNTTYKNDHHILTLGTDKVSCRRIQCPLIHYPYSKNICINGVLYYLTHRFEDGVRVYVIVYFDFRSEKFKFIDEVLPNPFKIKFINYKGKLGGIELMGDPDSILDELHMWVLEDVEKKEWSKSVYTLPKKIIYERDTIYVAGLTATGEIVLSERSITSKPFYVFYFNPKRNTLLSVEIIGFEKGSFVYTNYVRTIVDHVEDLNFNIMKTTSAATSISPPEHEHINII